LDPRPKQEFFAVITEELTSGEVLLQFTANTKGNHVICERICSAQRINAPRLKLDPYWGSIQIDRLGTQTAENVEQDG
jgi:hypothetical protein